MTIAEPQPDVDTLLANRLRDAQPALWTNPARQAQPAAALPALGRSISLDDTKAAAARLDRFAGLLAQVFPELATTGGVVDSPLLPAATLVPALGLAEGQGRLFIKADHSLPVAGSIKARGGMHEVLEFAEGLALQHGLVEPGGDYRALATPAAREVLGRYQVAVGSTGNLGMSIGVVASALGFQATVHMSADAKEWKKDRLRQRGVQVVEHAGDYERAVAAGRAEATSNPLCHFVDDEQSFSLLLGYSAAALHLKNQLAEQGVAVDAEHPLIVYLPCGVGGAPAGITFGLRQVLGPHVHCFFVEPVQSPCFMVQMLAGPGEHPSVYDWGLTNRTEADGLAVPRASLLAAELMRPLLSGVFTVADDTLFALLVQVLDALGERIEPSAAAGFSGPAMLTGTTAGQAWLRSTGVDAVLHNATHLVWTTGGLLVPDAQYQGFVQRGRAVLAAQG
ncbi:D-serine ammonia-lyase [Acidovorax sp. HMWF029]|uniref:D-serine ammonia-lyase n=1 Tax=Acidovorax sp. HMWF029 TaxID=2056863 RepID=UPI000D381994|nr:D-serine ammonia-lyase [Acidovorax sp. HMWF029]PTT22048.1 D-serine ammonia-lyase [Acidovorax sp. HMWF029]